MYTFCGQEFTWELNGNRISSDYVKHSKGEIQGVLVLDIDGTLTSPGRPYSIYQQAIDVLGEFLSRGGSLIFCSGATRGRIERTVLAPLFNHIEDLSQDYSVRDFFRRIIVIPENGAAILTSPDIRVIENEIHFVWKIMHSRSLEQKDALRTFLHDKIIPHHKGTYILDDLSEEKFMREYMLSLKNLPEGSPRAVIQEIRAAQEDGQGIDWSKVEFKAARTTVDFINPNCSKTSAIRWVLSEIEDLRGPILGFGDLGDEFGLVVPTINVNQKKPNEFRIRGVPSLELTQWRLLGVDEFIIAGTGKDSVVLDKKTGKLIRVLRFLDGAPILAAEDEDSVSFHYDSKSGRPIEINPGKTEDGTFIEDAGAGTAWIIRRMMDVGYFNP